MALPATRVSPGRVEAVDQTSGTLQLEKNFEINRVSSFSAEPPKTFRRIEDDLAEGAAWRSDKPALVAEANRLTYGELFAHAAQLARELKSLGVTRGERVCIYLDKTPEAVAACYGVWFAGAILVPAHEVLHTQQLNYILEHSGSRVLVTNARKLARFGIKPIDQVAVLDYSLPKAPHAIPDLPRRSADLNEPAAILYTSGSTGRPKGILISHDNLIAGARIVSRYLELREDERIISIPPFSFDYGLNQLLCSVKVGATLVLQRSHLPADICRTLRQEAITGMAAVPPLWLQMLGDASPFTRMEFPDLRYITNTGGVFPAKAVQEYRRLLPHVRIYLMYGLSEAFRSTYLPPEEIDRRHDTIGKAIPETTINVVKDGRECEPDEVGELVHRGPTVALGYWRDPEATARVFRPFRDPGSTCSEVAVYSGDYVKRDAEGFLYFVGRRDAMIKTQGFRVSPEEVEEVILASGLVREAAAVGNPDEVAGAVIVVHLVPKDRATFSEALLLDFCRREMPRHMVPRSIHLHEALPRTGSGKLDRKKLAS
jgi:acyl-CoA ligase (AMP-forming) (exosortase A-associated)